MAAAVSEKAMLLIGVLALQFLNATFHVVSRTALNMGISQLVFLVYRNIIALALLGPFAYFLEKKDRPPLTFMLVVKFFFLAIVGITANQGFYLLGLYYLSPTYASAIQNTVPAITFIMAACLRLEQVSIEKMYGLAKVVGTVVSIGGATVITLYKGLPLIDRSTHNKNFALMVAAPSSLILNWTLGCLFILCHCLSWAGWMAVQIPVLKKYPARLSLLSLIGVFGLAQFLLIAAFFENNPERWKVHSGGELLTILYSGLVASGIAFALQTWCIEKGGPLFTSVFQPVQTVVVAVMSAVILGDELYTGGIIGASLIVIGLYLVLWGKSEEKKASSNGTANTATAANSTEGGEDLRRHLINQEDADKDPETVAEV